MLSIATGTWDWEYAHQNNQLTYETRFLHYVAANARTLLQGVLDCAGAAGNGDPEGLKQVIDCLAMEVQLCNQIGHSRPDEGSEHYFAYAVENKLPKGLPHGFLVGPGIIRIAEKQGQNTKELEQALKACHVPLSFIPQELIH